MIVYENIMRFKEILNIMTYIEKTLGLLYNHLIIAKGVIDP